jgi:adenine C2-methylase RlmN of 23S rRNA A2503 and tRNA A37
MEIERKIVDQSGTAKYRLTTHDRHKIEATVFCAGDGTENVCVSCQAGCSYDCTHCATGTLGLGRNLTAKEMFEQVTLCHRRPTVDVLYMGMGEPFVNLPRVLDSITMLVAAGIVLDARHAHIATSGIAGPGWQILQKIEQRPTISVSFHAGTDAVRQRIIPHGKSMNLAQLSRAIREYKTRTGDQVFLNYTPLKEVNDSFDEFEAFCRLVRDLDCVARITPFNAWSGATVFAADVDKLDLLESRLQLHECAYLKRPSRGSTVFGGCGQLGAIA